MTTPGHTTRQFFASEPPEDGVKTSHVLTRLHTGQVPSLEPPADHRGLRLLTIALTLAALACLLVTAIDHRSDRYRIDHVSGVWLVLADAAKDGTLYPPLRDAEGRLGGTRYMPAGILAMAGLTKVTGDLLLAGKALSILGSLALAGSILWLLRHARAPLWLSLGLVACLFATEPGQIALLTARQEAWPAALQLFAVLVIAKSRSSGAAILAASLSVLALLTKLSAVWAPVSIGLWLLFGNAGRDRKAWLIYCLSYWLLAAAILGGLHWWTHGRMLESILGLGGAGLSTGQGRAEQLFDAIARLARALASDAPVIWALAGLSIATLALGVTKPRNLGALALAQPISGVLLVVLFADVGVASNHLLDFGAISAVLAGVLATRWISTPETTAEPTPTTRFAEAILAGVVALSLALAIPASLLRPAITAAKGIVKGAKGGGDEWSARVPLAGRFHSQSKVLFEDPSLWLAIGQRPEFSDPFMLPRLFAKHPDWAQPLVDRVTRREYEAIVLIRPIHQEFDHYERIHLGPAIGRAILEHYELKAVEAGRWVYQPRTAKVPSEPSPPKG